MSLAVTIHLNSFSDVEENRLVRAAEMDVECVDGLALARRTRRDQRLPALRLLDDVQHRVAAVGRGLVAEIHPRRKPDVDAAGRDPEADVRRHGLAAAPSGDRAGLDGVDAIDA